MRKRYLLFILIITFIFLNNGFVHALEVPSYPSVFGLAAPSSSCTVNSCLAQYIAYWFGVLIYIGGFISLISFVVGAVGLINPSIEAHSNAKDRMKGAILGLVLTFASAILLNTINTQFKTVAYTVLPTSSGIFLTNGSQLQAAGTENPDTSSITPGFNTIKYCCNDKCNGGEGTKLLVFSYPKKNYETGGDYSKVNVAEVLCGQTAGAIGGSYKIKFETPGVYYFLKSNCQGFRSDPTGGSQDNVGDIFGGGIKSIKIVNDTKSNVFYGAILHKDIGSENLSKCTKPLINNKISSDLCQSSGDGYCCKVSDIDVYSASIFTFNKNSQTSSSGSGVSFYSEPYGLNATAQKRGEGFCDIKNNKIKDVCQEQGDKFLFSMGGGNKDPKACDYAKDTSTDYKNMYKTFKDKPGSININGSYVVALYDCGGNCGGSVSGETCIDDTGGSNSGAGSGNGTYYCQVFSNSVPNLKVQSFIAESKSMDTVYIISTK